MLTHLGNTARRWAESADPWTNVYGLARTILALATATTLVFSSPAALFRPAAGMPLPPICDGPGKASLFCLLPPEHIAWERWVAVAILLVVASGWRPRITGVVHWWISFSLQASVTIIDGGDQATAILTLLLVPVALTDSRAWHWDAPPARACVGAEEYRRLFALMALTLCRLQVCGIYFHAAAGKFGVEEWANGTALYYWFTSPTFGAPPWLERLLEPVLVNGTTVSILTWSVVALEFVLAAALVMPKRRWRAVLVAGIALHAGIIVIHGLVSFGTMMMAALVLYLVPVERPLGLPPFVRRVGSACSNGLRAISSARPRSLLAARRCART